MRKRNCKALFICIISMILSYYLIYNVHITPISYIEKKLVGEKIQVISQQEIGTDTWMIIYITNGDTIYLSVCERSFLSFLQIDANGLSPSPYPKHEIANGKQGYYMYSPFKSNIGHQWVYWGIIWDDTIEKAIHCGNEMNFIHGIPPVPSICWYIGEGNMDNTMIETLPVLS